MGKRKRRPGYNTKASKTMAQRAKWMRDGAATIHEQISRDILKDICSSQNLTLKNQKIFYNEKNNKWYIADFFIPELRLIIEIDGSSHKGNEIYDAVRTEFLESIGNKVARFDNKEVDDSNFREKIYSQLMGRIKEVPVTETKEYHKPSLRVVKKKKKHKAKTLGGTVRFYSREEIANYSNTRASESHEVRTPGC